MKAGINDIFKIIYMKKIILLIILLLLAYNANAQIDPLQTKDSIAQTRWVDSIMRTMTVNEKIGQLFMVAAFSNKDKAHTDFIENLITKHKLGNLVFMQGTAVGHAALINKYQSISKIPLLIAIDGEWGLDMRLKNTVGFPYNMALGAIRDDRLIGHPEIIEGTFTVPVNGGQKVKGYYLKRLANLIEYMKEIEN